MKHRIEIRPYDYKCGDGCCDQSGIVIKLDGELVADVASCCELEALEAILEKLGVEAEVIQYGYDGEEV